MTRAPIDASPDDASQVSEGYVDLAGMPTRDELVDYYAVESGRQVDDIDYYVILARWKLAIVLEQGYRRSVDGTGDNEKLAAFGPIVLDLMRRAAERRARPPTPRRGPVPVERCDGGSEPDGQGRRRHLRRMAEDDLHPTGSSSTVGLRPMRPSTSSGTTPTGGPADLPSPRVEEATMQMNDMIW